MTEILDITEPYTYVFFIYINYICDKNLQARHNKRATTIELNSDNDTIKLSASLRLHFEIIITKLKVTGMQAQLYRNRPLITEMVTK